MKKIIKRVIFSLIVVALFLVIFTIVKVGRFEDLEGYMYSFAAEMTATDSNATSTNATSSNVFLEYATTPNATSSDIPYYDATSSNATSSNVYVPVATTPNATTPNATTPNVTIPERVDTDVLKTSNKVSSFVEEIEDVEIENKIENTIGSNDYVSIQEENVVLEENNSEVDNEVSFLESKKVYIMILAGSLLVIIIVSIILVLDKKVNKTDIKK